MPHEYQASFMKYFDKKDDVSPRANPGPSNKGGGINIRNYFPSLPSNMDFKEYVRFLGQLIICHQLLLQLKTLSLNDLEQHMSELDIHMDQEIESLRKRYHSKRQPILAAMDAKKRQQQNRV